MPKTDAEWQALGARIARDLMGCVKWEELTEEEQGTVKRWRVWRHYDGYWWQRGEGTPRLMCGTLLWQPHLKVAQALMVLEALSQKGVSYSIVRFTKRDVIVKLWGYLRGRFRVVQRIGEVLQETICLAVEVWLEAQKEKKMTLDDAKTCLEALPGIYEVSMLLTPGHWTRQRPFGGDTLGSVQFCVRCASPELLPEETRQGILRIYETLEREFGCLVSFAVSAGLRMPDWASS